MAKYLLTQPSEHMDAIFTALADPTRRDILQRLTAKELTVTEIAKPYHFALPTISKHLKVLEKADLITKEKNGREYKVHFEPQTMKTAAEYIAYYTRYWNTELDNLEKFLANPPSATPRRIKEVKNRGT